VTPAEVQVLLDNQARARGRRLDDRPSSPAPAAPPPEAAPAGRLGRLRLVLPYPPSSNTLYRTIVRGARAIPIKSAEHRRFFEAVEAALPRRLRRFEADVPLRVTLRLFRPRRVGDVDGPVKALLDSLNGHAWADDGQVEELHVFRGDDKHRPRVEVEVEEVARGS
jgi:Holliday junction resolvase RusA-like endonuclease